MWVTSIEDRAVEVCILVVAISIKVTSTICELLTWAFALSLFCSSIDVCLSRVRFGWMSTRSTICAVNRVMLVCHSGTLVNIKPCVKAWTVPASNGFWIMSLMTWSKSIRYRRPISSGVRWIMKTIEIGVRIHWAMTLDERLASLAVIIREVINYFESTWKANGLRTSVATYPKEIPWFPGRRRSSLLEHTSLKLFSSALLDIASKAVDGFPKANGPTTIKLGKFVQRRFTNVWWRMASVCFSILATVIVPHRSGHGKKRI